MINEPTIAAVIVTTLNDLVILHLFDVSFSQNIETIVNKPKITHITTGTLNDNPHNEQPTA